MESASDACESSVIFGSEEAVDHPCCICIARDNKDVESLKYCTDCAYYLCPSCTDWHANMPSMTYHQVLNVSRTMVGYYSEKVTLPRQQCQSHDGRILDLFCPIHDQLACVVCSEMHHKNCQVLQYVPRIAVGIQKSQELGQVKLATQTLLTRLKDTKAFQISNLYDIDTDEATNRSLIQEGIGSKLHQRVAELVTTEYDKIALEYQVKKDQVRKHVERLDDQIKHIETSDKDLSDFQAYNDADVFVIMKQADKQGEDGRSLLRKMSLDHLELPSYRLDGNIDKVLSGIDALGYFGQRVTVLQKREQDVKTADDTDVCDLGDVCLLVDGSMVITDWRNKSLKHLYDNGITRLDLDTKPSCVCRTSIQTEVAVTLPEIHMVKIVSLEIENQMKITRSFSIGKACRGICFNNSEYFLCCGHHLDPIDGSVHVFDLRFASLRIIRLDRTGQSLFGVPRRITVSPDGRLIHVTDAVKGVLTLDRAGNPLAEYSDIAEACGICTVTGGDLLVAGRASSNVIHIASYEKKIGDVLSKQKGVVGISSLCYDEANSRLIICIDDCDTIAIVDLRVH